jgi:hypothetical protein
MVHVGHDGMIVKQRNEVEAGDSDEDMDEEEHQMMILCVCPNFVCETSLYISNPL